ncbi:MAG: 2-phospho-L-lactate transferase [Chloroflexi bacterium]|nr:2-phospho-L-lactate transferase [Chloroflexota bacterium]MQC26964.1 2-phospho-L-lactate transferase [Chloroflexota bacterium]
MTLKIVAIAGGVGGAKLAEGLYRVLPANALTVIVNTADDFEHLGLHISPDLDTVCYTLAGIANPETGWGRDEETWNALDNISSLGGPDWFRLGDRDLGMHLERTRRLHDGQSLSEITAQFCAIWKVNAQVLPMSNHPVATIVDTYEGELAFQEYFVARRCEPVVRGFRFEGVQIAAPAPGVLEAIEAADVVVICPSNPWVSIDPVLAVPGIREAIQTKPTLAVSPIIRGQTVKGPAAKMFVELGIKPSAEAVAAHYGRLLSAYVFDRADAEQTKAIEALGIMSHMTDTLMNGPKDRQRLAGEIIEFVQRVIVETPVKSYL